MSIEVKGSQNYSAVVVRVPAVVDLPGLDNLRGVPIFGYQALVQKHVQVGDLMLLFPAEVQLSEAYVRANNMYRHAELNADPSAKGYIEDNRRVKALKMRGHRSDALLMPLSSISLLFGQMEKPKPDESSELHEGDTFDTYGGVEICRKYVPKGLKEPRPGSLQVKKEQPVDKRVFPEHVDTDNFWRNIHKIRNAAGPLVITQKLHGTSGRWGRVPVTRKLSWLERLAKRLGVRVQEHEFKLVSGSRKVIKGVVEGQNHFYGTDIWSEYGERIGDLIPEGFIVYGEIIGWTSDGQAIQPNYTYNLLQGQSELYIYRVARIDARGVQTDLSWPAVQDWARDRGLKTVPLVDYFDYNLPDVMFEDLLDLNFAHAITSYAHPPLTGYHGVLSGWEFIEQPVPLSDPKSADEGFVVRQDGRELVLLKAKSPAFLRHESKVLDKGTVDIETAESADSATTAEAVAA